MITVWGRRSSFNTQKVLWLVGELGLQHNHIPAGGTFGRLHEPAFRALNPHGWVPVVQDGDLAVWESHAILRYLAARYGEGTFWNNEPAVRARVDGWMDWSQTALQPAFLMGVFWGFYRTPAEHRDWASIQKNLDLCAGYFHMLDTLLAKHPFLSGDALSLADVVVGTSLYRYYGLDIARPSMPNVEAWYDRLQRRPAYRTHVMVPFAELQGRLAY
jgi:glutathione S-transferase